MHYRKIPSSEFVEEILLCLLHTGPWVGERFSAGPRTQAVPDGRGSFAVLDLSGGEVAICRDPFETARQAAYFESGLREPDTEYPTEQMSDAEVVECDRADSRRAIVIHGYLWPDQA